MASWDMITYTGLICLHSTMQGVYGWISSALHDRNKVR